MTSALDLVEGAFQAIQVYAPGESCQQADLARGFLRLNQMIDSWSNEALTTFTILEQSGALQPGIGQYPIGPGVPGPGFNMTRPIRVLYGPGAAYLRDQNSNRYPVKVVPRDEWNLIWNLVKTSSNLPDTMFYDPTYPVATINVWPLPNTGGITLFWDSYLPLSKFGSLQEVVNLPPGYEKALEENLGIELSPYYPTAVITQALVRSAAMSKGNVKRSNTREMVAVYEFPARGNRRPYNIYSDNYR